jgi:molybdate transport repressor ModE-like protein
MTGSSEKTVATAEETTTHDTLVPNIRHLRVLESVARNESIGRASLEIGLSQPSVTQAIAKVEALLGRQLFERRRNGSYLTAAGDVYMRRVRRFLEQSDEALSEFGAENTDRAYVRHVTSTQIRCLLSIAKSNSFSQAARSVGKSVQSLHRAARELETITQQPLYSFSKYGLTLTDIGQELARKLSLATREIEAVEDDLHYLDGVESGKILIGTLPMSGAYLIGRTIADLTNKFPDARVFIINAPYDILVNSLKTGAIDMIFGVLRGPVLADDLKEEEIFSDPNCIVARFGHPLATRDEISVNDLLAYEWIVPLEGSPRRTQYDAIFADSPERPRISIETSSFSTIRSVLACSDRLALANRQEVEAEQRLKILSILRWNPKQTGMPKGITTRSNWLTTPIQQRFLKLLRLHATSTKDFSTAT